MGGWPAAALFFEKPGRPAGQPGLWLGNHQGCETIEPIKVAKPSILALVLDIGIGYWVLDIGYWYWVFGIGYWYWVLVLGIGYAEDAT